MGIFGSHATPDTRILRGFWIRLKLLRRSPDYVLIHPRARLGWELWEAGPHARASELQ